MAMGCLRTKIAQRQYQTCKNLDTKLQTTLYSYKINYASFIWIFYLFLIPDLKISAERSKWGLEDRVMDGDKWLPDIAMIR